MLASAQEIYLGIQSLPYDTTMCPGQNQTVYIYARTSDIMLAPTQNIYIDIESYPHDTTLCLDFNETVYVNAQEGCQDFYWSVNGQITENVTPLIINPVAGRKTIQYYSGPDCGDFYHSFKIKYVDAPVVNSFHKKVWGLPGAITTLHAMGIDSIGDYEIQWQGGPNDNDYDVILPGEYPVTISSPCGSSTRVFQRCDMAKIAAAGTNPATGEIVLEWDASESILQYANLIEFYVDDTTNLIGIADITDGLWTDTVTQNTAVRNYWCRTVSQDGERSPLVGPTQTIFCTTLPTTNDTIAVALWDIPQGYDEFQWFRLNQIMFGSKDEPVINHIDSVAATETRIEFNIGLVNDGNKVFIEALYPNEKSRTRRVSPRSNTVGQNEVVGIIENSDIENSDKADNEKSWIYPNPASNGQRITINGTGILTIRNMQGQVVLPPNNINNKVIFDGSLPPGVLLVTLKSDEKVHTAKLIVTQ